MLLSFLGTLLLRYLNKAASQACLVSDGLRLDSFRREFFGIAEFPLTFGSYVCSSAPPNILAMNPSHLMVIVQRLLFLEAPKETCCREFCATLF